MCTVALSRAKACGGRRRLGIGGCITLSRQHRLLLSASSLLFQFEIGLWQRTDDTADDKRAQT
ncbi:hypothetical protein HRbin28_01407 [bacterium HR28]|nr:hypothetical protein HRbin28_01407 [bacterium HR28]